MFQFFSRKKTAKEEKVNLSDVVLKNRAAIDILEKRQQHLERRIAVQAEDAKNRAKSNDKRGALFALKRKKMLEQELEQLVNAHISLEQQIITLESAQTQQIAVGALSAGVSAQKILNQQMNLNKLDDLIEDIHEQNQQQSEIFSVLNQGQSVLEDDELLAELNQIEAQNMDELLAEAVPAPAQPLPIRQAVPTQYTAAPPLTALPAEAVGYTAYGNASAPSKTSKLSDEEQLQNLWKEFS